MLQGTLPFLELPQVKKDDGLSWHHYVMDALEVESGPGWPDRFGQSLRLSLLSDGIEPIRTLSLFSGGGGLDIGFHDAGFQIVEMVEIEGKFVRSLLANAATGSIFDGARVCCTDIRDYTPVPSLDVDFIIGGPLCAYNA